MNSMRLSWVLLPAGLLVSGCASLRNTGFEQVNTLVVSRSGQSLQRHESRPEGEIKAKTYELLKGTVTVDAAVRIALLNNRTLQATLEELGIAKADLVEAGLLENPHFAGGLGFSPENPGKVFPHFAVTQDILGVFLLPLRRKAAASQFEEAKLRVGNAVLEVIAKVKAAYHRLQAAEQARDMIRNVAQSAEAAAELARRQFTAGNVNELNLAFQQTLAHEARIELARRATELELARDDLSEVLGILGQGTELELNAPLPELPPAEVPRDNLEALALSQRLDLGALRHKVASLERSLSLARWQIVPSVNAGIESEKDPEGQSATGPELEMEIPIFNRGQAKRGRLRAQLRQGRQALAALETQVRKEVRAARARLLEARKLAGAYRDDLIPLRAKIVQQTQLHYNFMLLGVYQLLEAKREEIHARREYIDALRNYWIERANLERAVSGKFEVARGAPEPARPGQPAETPPGEHHEHRKEGDQQ